MAKHMEIFHKGEVPDFDMQIISRHKKSMVRQLSEAMEIRLEGDKVDVVMNSKNDWRQPDLIRWTCVDERDRDSQNLPQGRGRGGRGGRRHSVRGSGQGQSVMSSRSSRGRGQSHRGAQGGQGDTTNTDSQGGQSSMSSNVRSRRGSGQSRDTTDDTTNDTDSQGVQHVDTTNDTIDTDSQRGQSSTNSRSRRGRGQSRRGGAQMRGQGSPGDTTDTDSGVSVRLRRDSEAAVAVTESILIIPEEIINSPLVTLKRSSRKIGKP